MIYIKEPFIVELQDKSRLICDIYVDDEKRTVWFETDKEYCEFLCYERGDAYLIGLIYYAMLYGHDIKCDVPISEELYYNITTYLIPSLYKYGYDKLNKITIKAELAPVLMTGDAVGTGCSCGIDSFHAIYNHISCNLTSFNLTHLCLNNVGAFNDCYKSYGKERVKQERYETTKTVAHDLGLPLILTDSNFAEVFPQNHLRTSTYSAVFAVYMMQKLYRIYFLASSGIDFSGFSLSKEGGADGDLLLLQCFSTTGLRIYSEGGEKTRLEKTKTIADYSFAQKYLHVCLSKPYNCGICSKCRRTLVTLDLIDKLDNFSQVFDINYYKEHKHDYYYWLLQRHYANDEMNEAVYQQFLKKESFRLFVEKTEKQFAKSQKRKQVRKIIRFPFHIIKRILRKLNIIK